MTLSLRLRHRFPGIQIDIAFETAAPGVTVLFGPSGSGKSTVIAAAAGLLRPDACRIAVGDRVLADTEAGIWLPPEARGAGLVFQDARLFPHMSVATNLRYGQRRAQPGRVDFDDVVDLLGIAALLAQPRLLLMDEPLASLDQERKAEIMPFLARMKTALDLPVLYVTHALDEVTRLADSVVLLDAGHVVAAGSLSDIASRAGLPLARRDDAGAVLLCRVVAHDPARELTLLRGAGADLWVPLSDAPVDAPMRVRIPAREVILAGKAPEAISLHNIIPGTVRTIVADAVRRSVMVEIALEGGALLSRVTPDAVARLGLGPGVPVLALVKSTAVEVIRA